MGNCRYCNTKAGIFKDSHGACSRDAAVASSDLNTLIVDAVKTPKDVEQLAAEIETVRIRGRLSLQDVQPALLHAADKAIQVIAMESPVSNDEHERLGSLFQSLDKELFTHPEQLAQWSGFLSLVYSNTLFQVLNGQVPYQDPSLAKGFILQRNEQPVARRNVQIAEYKTIPAGRSYQSVSLPIGGGLYYRLGASQPMATRTGLVPVDQGLMLITTQSIIFCGQSLNFRLPFDSIIRIEPFTDGFEIHPNHGKGKVFIPATIGTIDEGWYFYNLVSALATQKH